MKKVSLQFGGEKIEIILPDSADVRKGAAVKPLKAPAKKILQCLHEPIGTKSLPALAKGKDNAAIVVSDNTRPVPYKGDSGILAPIIKVLKQNGVKNIKVIIAYGTHRSMKKTELRQIFDENAFQDGVEILNHNCTDSSMLRSIGRAKKTADITINRYYLDAQLKIITGLVEPHFMAGFSGGCKAVCPGICGQSVTYGFHSAEVLNNEKTDNLILEGNPCHEESLQIAKMAGVDFIVNVILNSDKEITGVFSGDLEKAHLAAIEHLRTFTTVRIEQPYDIVITQAADVGVNHYQCAKGAYGASYAVKKGGYIIMSANLTEPDVIGSENYKRMQKLLAQLGAKGFISTIRAKHWVFVPDQWETQMWAKAFKRLGVCKNLHICAPKLEHCPQELIPETNVASEIKRLQNEPDIDFVQRMTQRTVDRLTQTAPEPKILVLPDGPYTIPVLKK